MLDTTTPSYFDAKFEYMQTLTSERLSLNLLQLFDSDFIFELVNTPDWIRFIGDRNVTSKAKAVAFVHSVINNANVNYWVVRLKKDNVPVGIVSLVKRDYLDSHDVGFAFLPEHTKKGFAYEAARTLLSHLAKENLYPTILATTNKENSSSIALLKKLGFQLDKEMKVNEEELLIFSISTDQILIDGITKSFFQIFTNARGCEVNLDELFNLCIAETQIIKVAETREEIHNLKDFIAPRQAILTNGTLTAFEEREVESETRIANRIAYRHSRFQKQGCLNGNTFKQSGNKFFHFIKTGSGWKISGVIWEDDKAGPE